MIYSFPSRGIEYVLKELKRFLEVLPRIHLCNSWFERPPQQRYSMYDEYGSSSQEGKARIDPVKERNPRHALAMGTSLCFQAGLQLN